MKLLLVLALLQIGCVIHRALSRDEVMREIGQHFPVEAHRLAFYARIEKPDVQFIGDKLELRVEVEAGGPPVMSRGYVIVEGQVEYRQGGIYMTHSAVKELSTGLGELPRGWSGPIEQALELAVLAVLDEKPIYQIHDGRVKKVWLERDKLMLEIRP
jgi:hypothetical protein